MSDLYNKFPSWGESGSLPVDGFFYEGGDQVNEKHLDALWNNTKTHIDNINTAIRDRVREIEGDTILDQGLVASAGTNAREVDVSASTAGAYVDGQQTGSTTLTTVTLSTNGTTSTRTDSVWVDTTGQVGKTEGTTTVSSGRMKVAEADVSSADSISAIRNYGRDRVRSFAAENIDAGQVPGGILPGDIWYDLVSDKLNGRIGGAWRNIATEPWAKGGNILHADLSDAPASAHHAKPGGGTAISFDGTNNEYDILYGNALTTDVNGNLAVSEADISHDNIIGVSANDHHTAHEHPGHQPATSAVDANGNVVNGLTRLNGNAGNHRIRFDSNNSYIEFTDQTNTRSDIVTGDTYVNDPNSVGWLSDLDNSTNNSVDADMVDGSHASDFIGKPTWHVDTYTDSSGTNGTYATYNTNSATIIGAYVWAQGNESSGDSNDGVRTEITFHYDDGSSSNKNVSASYSGTSDNEWHTMNVQSHNKTVNSIDFDYEFVSETTDGSFEWRVVYIE